MQAQAALVAAVSRGELTPSEAAEVSALLENQRRALETSDHEARLQALEEERSLASADGPAPSRPRSTQATRRIRALLKQLNR